MSDRAEAAFEITGWDDSSWDDSDGVQLGRVTVRKQFSGDLSGASVAEVLTVQIDGSPVEFRAIERIEGKLGGRPGTFVISHGAGPGESDGETAPVRVLRGSGTGELAGLTGSGEIGHGFLRLEYELG